MTPKLSASKHSNDQTIRARVLHAIAGNRFPGLHFPGHFLDIKWIDVTGGTARATLEDGPHIGNRVGHVQGGILLGLAATTACAAAPAAMMLSNVSAWYISPGRGDKLRIRSRILHTGRTTVVVRTEIKAAGGERVLEAVSHHVARK
ncbi:MAG: PaaI family thioesterase [Deltaproteobacteria bacterium]|nr:PaaI family thioesterase [Deltaproteobacteria bacterium]